MLSMYLGQFYAAVTMLRILQLKPLPSLHFSSVSVLHLFTAVVTTTTHTTVVTTSPQQYPQQYPQQPTATPGQPQSYQGAQYPPYQPIPVQTGYGAQPMPQGYGPQPLPTSPYHGQGFIAPPPSYQEASECGFLNLDKELQV